MIQASVHKGTVAITRNGLGEFYLFDTFEEADTHPIIQYGDVICRGPDHIMNQFTYLELPGLLRRLGDESLRNEILVSARSPLGRDETMRRYGERVWGLMCERASPPPESAEEIVSIIVRDRTLSIKERTMNEKTAEKPKAAEEKKPSTTVGGFEKTAKITLLADDEGKPYGKDNNPKREGTKSAERFTLYKNDMTVEEATGLGLTAGDLKNDTDKKFIQIK